MPNKISFLQFGKYLKFLILHISTNKFLGLDDQEFDFDISDVSSITSDRTDYTKEDHNIKCGESGTFSSGNYCSLLRSDKPVIVTEHEKKKCRTKLINNVNSFL